VKPLELVAGLKRLRRGWSLHSPHPKQAEFLDFDGLEALYGGAAGGGKSDALLMAALQYVDVSGYNALLLRRTYKDLALPEAIMDRAHTWLRGTAATWHELDKRYSFPSGATLSFGYLDTDRDRFRYQSAAFQFIGWDELTQFPEGWYRYLFSRLRRADGVNVPLRMRGATNPGGIGHKWVKHRFIDEPRDRLFVPAILADNPTVDAAGYRKSLAQLDSTTRRQLEEGVWVLDASGLVFPFDASRDLIDEAAVPKLDRFLLSIDFGYTDPTAFVILGWQESSSVVYVLRAWKQAGMIPSSVAEVVKAMSRELRFDRIVGDEGGMGKGYAAEMRQTYAIPVMAAEKTDKLGSIALVAGAIERGEVKFVRGQTEDLTGELEELPWNEDHTTAATGFDDHCADALRYGWRAARAVVLEADPPEPPEPELGLHEAAAARWQQRKEAIEDGGGDWLSNRYS
jgi:hypothetical protein